MGFIEVYGFLFVLGLIWTLIASVQDIKTTFVANWLTYSLVIFGLAYRLFYGAVNEMFWFFLIGVIGFGIFFVLAHLFYYAKVFGGGDAKLLMGIGVVLPYNDFVELSYFGSFFLVLFLLVGSVYGLLMSLLVISKKKKEFRKEFRKNWEKKKSLFLFSSLFGIVVFIFGGFNLLIFIWVVLVAMLPLIYICVKSLDACMIVSKSGKELLEGDWLIDDVKIGNHIVKKTVHGLSLEDIALIKKGNKKVLIKEGIPFVPAFLISFVMVYALIALGVFQELLALLF